MKKIYLFAILLFSLALIYSNSSAQNQYIALINFTDDPLSGGQPSPVMFNDEPAQDGWIVQIICDGAGDGIDPPVSTGNPDAGMPTDDDFLADSLQNGLYAWYFNGVSIMGEEYAGIFLPFNYLICLPESLGTEPVINVGDQIYLRAFNSTHWSTATLYSNMTEPIEVQQVGPPQNYYVQFSPQIELSVGGAEAGYVVTEYKLQQNFPNPFNPGTTIEYDVLESGKVYLSVYNIRGQEVARLIDGEYKTGPVKYSYYWNTEGLSSGIYFYEVRVNSFKDTKKMLLLR
jgi:hypothetical protein